jgi:hypothetical protein
LSGQLFEFCLIADILSLQVTQGGNMIQRFIGGLLLAVIGCQAAPKTPKEQMAWMPLGTLVEVRMQDDTQVRGRLSRVEDDAFTLTVSQARDAAQRRIPFSEVTSVRKEGPPLARRVVHTIGGILVFPIIMLFTGLSVANGWIGQAAR